MGVAKRKMEVCVDSLESALNAAKGGANRLELCSDLYSGGTTPSVGLLRLVKRRIKDIPVFVMIRPRGGDFCYSNGEIEVMKEDIIILKDEGADGFVFGILTSDGLVDNERCTELLVLAKPCPITFHRAFDLICEPLVQLEELIKLGFHRVLTSGCASTALDGVALLQQLVKQADNRIIVMPGAGITVDNVQTIIDQSGAREFHGSASRVRDSVVKYKNEDINMGTRTDEFTVKVTDSDLVSKMISLAQEIWKYSH